MADPAPGSLQLIWSLADTLRAEQGLDPLSSAARASYPSVVAGIAVAVAEAAAAGTWPAGG